MRIDAIRIEPHILEKIEAKHGVLFEEVEEACFSHHKHIRRVRRDVVLVLGRSAHGRHLAVLLARGAKEFWVVSARDMNLSERRLYGRQGK